MSTDIPVNPEKSKPTCMVIVSKDDAQKMKVGSPVSLDVSGTVKSIHPSYEDKEKYEITVEDPVVEVENDENESGEDDNYATMPREKLKEKIMPKDEE